MNNKNKTIFIRNLLTDEEIQLNVEISMTVLDLKCEIEKVFNLPKGFLSEYKLRCKNKGERIAKLLDNDNNTLESYRIKNFCKIIFWKENRGGGTINFTDVSKGNTKNIGFSSNGPNYRIAGKGINIFGICKCNKCETKGEEVVVPIKEKKINLIEEKFNLKCPICGSIIEPKTVGFWLCKYHIYGEKIENKKIVEFDSGYQEANDKENLKYYDKFSNGEAKFNELIFEVIQYY